MAELENVIKGLGLCKEDGNFCYDKKCPYEKNFPKCIQSLTADALSLLQAHGPVKPYIDYDGQDVWRCGSCGATLFHLSHTQADENEQNCVKFCRYCGKAVKWE